jgi:hypothetical protein
MGRPARNCYAGGGPVQTHEPRRHLGLRREHRGVGLFLACELRLAKRFVLVLEQSNDPHSPLKWLPFGMRGLWGPSLEAF